MSISRETLLAAKDAMERLEDIRAALALANNRESLQYICVHYPVPEAGHERLNRSLAAAYFDKEKVLCDTVEQLRIAEKATIDDLHQLIDDIGSEHGQATTARPGAAS